MDSVPDAGGRVRSNAFADDMNSIIHAPEYVAIIRRLLPVIRQQKAFCVMPFNEVCDRLAFYWNRGTFTFSIDDFGEPHGACLIRLFAKGEEFLDPLVHKPCNKFCMIDLLVADTPNVAAQLCEELTERWGRQAVIMLGTGTNGPRTGVRESIVGKSFRN